jgi:hypothetical protein
VSRIITTRHPGVAPLGRCDVCAGTGFVELKPLPDRPDKLACPACRALAEYRRLLRGALVDKGHR